LRGHFGFADAFYCGLLLIPAALLLLLTSYVLQHGKFAAVIPVLFAGLLVRAYPTFAVTLGLAVIGAVFVPAVTDWRHVRRIGL
jgi:flagellar biosynthesis protein FliP